MNTNTVNISFQKDLLKQIDELAKEESRSRSELIREAARMYIERKKRWDQIFAFGNSKKDIIGIKEEDLENIIHDFRINKRKKH
jgi:CopG family transcriptional regulator/antitoxin EndoAI